MKNSDRLFCRITPDDKRRVENYAQKSGMKLSDYLRRVALKGIIFKTEEVNPTEQVPAGLDPEQQRGWEELEKSRKQFQENERQDRQRKRKNA